MNIAFAGFQHSHILVLYNMAKENPLYNIVGAVENIESYRLDAISKGVVFNYNTYEELLCDKDVEVIAIGACYGDRGLMAIKALEAGKHVICDKPLCTSISELDQIEKIAKEKNLIVSCMLTMRFEPVILSLKKLVESGKLGEINNVYFGGQHPLQYGRRPNWYYQQEKHGGVINDIAIHGVDILSYVFGGKLKDIYGARTWNKYAIEQPQFNDCGQIMFSLNNGAGVIADVSYAIPDGVEFNIPCYWQFFIWGTNGVVELSFNKQNAYYYLKGQTEKNDLELINPDVDYLTDFINLIKGSENVIVPMGEVLESTRATLKLQEYADKMDK